MCCKFVAAFGRAYAKLILARGWRTAPTGVAAIAGNEDLGLTDRVSIRGLSIRGGETHPAGTARRWWQPCLRATAIFPSAGQGLSRPHRPCHVRGRSAPHPRPLPDRRRALSITTPPVPVALPRAFMACPRPGLCPNRNGRTARRQKAIAQAPRITAFACMVNIRACWAL